MARLYLLVILFGVLGGVGYGALTYYNHTQQTIAQLRENNVKLEQVAKTNQETIDNLQQSAIQLQEQNLKLQKEMQNAEKYSQDLINKLNKHDLTKLSQQKPKLMEEKINNATQRLFDDLMLLTDPDID